MSPKKVINIHHKLPYDVYIGRGSKWGNPFTHMDNTSGIKIAETREDAIAMYEMWIQTQEHLMASLKELDGKVLGCYCHPAPCHGNVLIELRNKQSNSNQ